jgi:hypothetical protein
MNTFTLCVIFRVMLKNCFVLFSIFIGWRTALCQTVALSMTQTRVLYQWVDNPLKVVVENTPCQNVIVKAKNGYIKGKGCEYIYTTNDTVFRDLIRVGVKRAGKIKWISDESYIVKKYPDPTVFIGAHVSGDSIFKNELRAQIGLTVPIFDFVCHMPSWRQVVTGYSIAIVRENRTIFSETVNSNLLTETFKEFIGRDVAKNDLVIVDNIVVLLYEKEIRKLEKFVLRIKG